MKSTLKLFCITIRLRRLGQILGWFFIIVSVFFIKKFSLRSEDSINTFDTFLLIFSVAAFVTSALLLYGIAVVSEISMKNH